MFQNELKIMRSRRRTVEYFMKSLLLMTNMVTYSVCDDWWRSIIILGLMANRATGFFIVFAWIQCTNTKHLTFYIFHKIQHACMSANLLAGAENLSKHLTSECTLFAKSKLISFLRLICSQEVHFASPVIN